MAEKLLAENMDASAVSNDLLKEQAKDERKSRKSVARKSRGIDAIARKSAAVRMSAIGDEEHDIGDEEHDAIQEWVV